MRDSFSSVSRQFECPVCLEIMRPPTKMLHCKNGHVLCLVGFPEKLSLSFSCIHIEQTCVQKGGITSCPSCRQPLLGRLIFSHILNCGINITYAFKQELHNGKVGRGVFCYGLVLRSSVVRHRSMPNLHRFYFIFEIVRISTMNLCFTVYLV